MLNACGIGGGHRRHAPGRVAVERSRGVARLDRLGGGQIGRVIHKRAHEAQHSLGRRGNLSHPVGQPASPSRRCDREGACFGAGRTEPDVGEWVRPEVDQLDRVVAPVGIRHPDHLWALGEVEPDQAVESVVVGTDSQRRRRGEFGVYEELVHRHAGLEARLEVALHEHNRRPEDDRVFSALLERGRRSGPMPVPPAPASCGGAASKRSGSRRAAKARGSDEPGLPQEVATRRPSLVGPVANARRAPLVSAERHVGSTSVCLVCSPPRSPRRRWRGATQRRT